MKTLWFVLVVAVLVACSDAPNEPPTYEEFTPVSADWDLDQFGEDVVAVGLVTFRDQEGRLVEGARVHVQPSAGSAGATTTDMAGISDVTWTFTTSDGTVTLKVCASNHATRCDRYHTVLTVTQ